MRNPAHLARRTVSLVVLALGLAALFAGVRPAAAADPPTGTFIPVVLNIYAGSGTTEAKAKDAIAEANKILAQTGAKLVVVKVNDPPAGNGGDDGSGGGTAGDGSFTPAERNNARDFGGKEIAGLPGKKGLKISFGKNPEAADPTNPGISIHRNPTVIVKDRGNAADTGSTIAHELGHVLTLGAAHVIDSTGGIRADGGGHAPAGDGDDKDGNLMSPSNRRKGTKLTPDQIDEIKKRLRTHGQCSTQFKELFPAVKCAQAFGRVVDGRELVAVAKVDHTAITSALSTTLPGSPAPMPGSPTSPTPPPPPPPPPPGPSQPGLVDMTEVLLSAVGDENGAFAEIDGQITVVSPPAAGPVHAVYTLGFDADANPSTGVTFAGMPGIDRIVRITLAGDGSAPFATGEVDDPVHGTSQPLPVAPSALVDEQFPDLDGVATPGSFSLLVSLPTSLLGLTAPQVPVVAGSGDGTNVYDTVSLLFDQQASAASPTLTTSGDGTPTPGAFYPFQVSGLHPFAPVSVYLDDALVYSGALDGAGGASASFVVPADLATDTVHFLTAQDPSGQFAGSITCPEWASLRLSQGAVARGGTLALDVGGARLRVPTRRGESASQVVSAVATAINRNTALAGRGIVAQPVGHRLKVNAPISGVAIRDAGLAPARASRQAG